MRGSILLLAAVAVLGLAACGGSGGSSSTTTTSGTRLSAAAYRAQIAQIKAEAAGAQAHVGTGLNAKTVAELKQKVDTFAAATQRMGDEVAKLNPPENAQAANTQLAQGMHDIAAATRTASAKVAKMKSVQAAISYLEHDSDPAKGSREVGKALATLKKLGYTTGS